MSGSTNGRPAPAYDSLIRISNVGARKNDGTLMSDRQQADSNVRAIENQGGRLGQTFEALNVSGGDVFDSPQWRKALDRIRQGQSAGVAIAYLDRFGRDTAKGLDYADALADAGGTIIIDGRKVDPDNPEERLMLIMGMGQAEYKLRTDKKRSRATRDDVWKRGITIRVPYGYMRNSQPDQPRAVPDGDPKLLVPDPEQAPVARLIFEMRAAGQRWTAIIRRLEADGVQSPTGRPLWRESTLSTLVRNRAYVGEVTVGARTTKDAHEPLIDPATFNAAQPRSGVVRTGANVPGVAGGLILCASCERPLSVSGRGTGSKPFYACRRLSSGGRCPRPVSGDRDSVDEALDAALREQAETGFDVKAVQVQREAGEARKALAKARWDLDQFLQATAGMDAAKIAKGLAGLNECVEAAEQTLADAEAAAVGVADFPTSGADWDALSLPAKRNAAAGVIKTMVLLPFPKGASKRDSVAGDRVVITWR